MSDELTKEPKRYALHSAFLTIQGEGAHAGRRAVFLRCSGCNVWSGLEEHRERDESKGFCAAICDTKFNGVDLANNGGKYTKEDVVKLVERLWDHKGRERPYVVITGGEPGLQLDEPLVKLLQSELGAYVAVETNGSVLLPTCIDWITLSPKPPMAVVKQLYSEIKCLHPVGALDPTLYTAYAPRRWIQPVDFAPAGERIHNISNMNEVAVAQCVKFVMKHPEWRLGGQFHKYWKVQ